MMQRTTLMPRADEHNEPGLIQLPVDPVHSGAQQDPTSSAGGLLAKVLLTPEEAGELLSLGRTKIYELMADGSLGSVTVGRSRRIPPAELFEFVDRLRRSPYPGDVPRAGRAEGATPRHMAMGGTEQTGSDRGGR